MTSVVNIKTGARCDVYIGRSKRPMDGFFGNPFEIGKDGDRETVLKRFKHYFEERLKFDREFKSRVLALRGKILGCFCLPEKCHGEIIAEYLDSLPG
jgi:hypothetical protein